MGKVTKEQIEQVYKENLGKSKVSQEQMAATLSVVSGSDTLAALPTHSGKTSIYQAAALFLDGSTVVVSPMLAALHEQKDSGYEKKIPNPVEVSSRRAPDAAFIMLTPDQLDKAAVRRLQKAKPALVVVDEAHCISERTSEFIPDYLRLTALLDLLGHPAVLAMTASASPPILNDIMQRLGMRGPEVVSKSLSRPNIWLGVEAYPDDSSKLKALVERAKREQMPGMAYAATPERAEQVAKALRRAGVRAAFYHENMQPGDLERVQSDFIGGKTDLLVSTPAFSLGIGNDSVHFVFHYDITDAPESYYQEMGRAGRDDQAARALIFYSPDDLKKTTTFTSGPSIAPEQAARVLRAVLRRAASATVPAIVRETGLDQPVVEVCLRRLTDLGIARFSPVGAVEIRRHRADIERTAQEIHHAQEMMRTYDLSREEMMRAYAETKGCRRLFLLNYFAEPAVELCGCCDNCASGAAQRSLAETPSPGNPPGAHVSVPEWGEGVVVRNEGSDTTVLFNSVGYKTLPASLVASMKRVPDAGL